MTQKELTDLFTNRNVAPNFKSDDALNLASKLHTDLKNGIKVGLLLERFLSLYCPPLHLFLNLGR